MRKTTVYLTDEEAEMLKRASAETGRSQSDIIRAGVREIAGGGRGRRFRSMAAGEGTGEPVGRTAEDFLSEGLTPRQ